MRFKKNLSLVFKKTKPQIHNNNSISKFLSSLANNHQNSLYTRIYRNWCFLGQTRSNWSVLELQWGMTRGAHVGVWPATKTRDTGRGVGKGVESPALCRWDTLPNLHVSFGGFMEASLSRHDWLDHWPLVTELSLRPFSPRSGGGTESSYPLNTGLVLQTTSPHPQVGDTHYHNKRHLLPLLT